MNLFKRFRDLMPAAPLLVGDVVDVNNGVATIQEPGGGLNTARGDAAIGDRVFFRDGAIEGPAPALTVETIEI